MNYYSRISNYLSFTIIFISVLHIIAWVVGIDSFKVVLPRIEAMKLNSAICVLLLGVSILGYNSKLRGFLGMVVSVIFPIIASLIGLVTLSEYLFSVNLGIDELFSKDNITPLTLYPGRMAFSGALIAILASISLYCLHTQKGLKLFQISCFLIFSISFLSILGYIYNVNFLQGGIVEYSKISLFGTISFLLLAVALLCAKTDFGFMKIFSDNGISGITLRRTLPYVFIIPIIVGGLRLVGEKMGYYDKTFGIGLFVLLNTMFFVILIFRIVRKLFIIDSERKKTLEGIEESKRKFEQIFEYSPECLFLVNREGIIIQVSNQCKKVFGYEPIEMLWQPAEKFISDISNPESTNQISSIFKTPEIIKPSETNSLSILNKNKEPVSIELLFGSFGPKSDLMTLVNIRDISERLRTEKIISASQKLFSAMFYKSPIMKTVMLASDGTYIKANEKFTEMIGMAEEECVGKTSKDFNIIFDQEKRDKIIDEVKKKGIINDVHIDLTDIKGKHRWLSVSIQKIILEERECLLSAMVDITKRMEALENIDES